MNNEQRPTVVVPSANVAWFLTVIRELAIVTAVVALIPTPGGAQSLVVSPRVSVMGGEETAGSYGLRAEVGSSSIALFGQGGAFRTGQACDLIPPCPSGGLELLGGVRLTLPRLGVVNPAVSLGAGVLVWDDEPPFKGGTESVWEAELRLGVRVFSWADLLLGGVVKSIGQSFSSGMTVISDRGTFGGIVVGLLIPVM